MLLSLAYVTIGLFVNQICFLCVVLIVSSSAWWVEGGVPGVEGGVPGVDLWSEHIIFTYM